MLALLCTALNDIACMKCESFVELYGKIVPITVYKNTNNPSLKYNIVDFYLRLKTCDRDTDRDNAIVDSWVDKKQIYVV